jgi:NAD(P)H dehydrogenase (quinone)
MILVTGSTGHFGRATINFLLKKNHSNRITALARDPKRAKDLTAQGVEVRQGDYTDYDSLAKAFAGVEKLLLVSSSALENVAEQHANAVKAAKETGVKHIVYTSIVSRSDNPHFKLINDYKKTENDLKSSGIAYTVLRNGYYMDMLPMFIGEALESGKIYYPAGDGRASFAARVDLAEAAANVLMSAGYENKIYHTGGNVSYSFHDIANALSELAGKKIEYVDIPLEVMKEELLRNQMSPPEIDLMAGIAESIKYNEGDCPSPDLENLLGRSPTSLKEFLKQVYF